jgi:3-oxoacyl-(acyl-carrier-protein) synthase
MIITGVGIVSCLGIGGLELFDRPLNSGNSPVNNNRIKEFSIKDYTKHFKQSRKLNKSSQYAIAGLRVANGIELFDEYSNDQVGVIIGTSYVTDNSAIEPLFISYNQLLKHANGKNCFVNSAYHELPPQWLLSQIPNICTYAIANEIGAHGYSNTVVSGGNSSFDAIMECRIVFDANKASCFICGGTDSPFNYVDEISNNYKVVNNRIKKNEINTGEGAVIYCIEKRDPLKKNNKKKTLGKISNTCGSYVLKSNDLYKNLKNVFSDTGIKKSDVDAIVFSDWSNYNKPSLSASNLNEFFSENAGKIYMTSLMDIFGYSRAASGAFDLAAALALVNNKRRLFASKNKAFSECFQKFSMDVNVRESYKNVLVFYTSPSNFNYCMLITRNF